MSFLSGEILIEFSFPFIIFILFCIDIFIISMSYFYNQEK